MSVPADLAVSVAKLNVEIVAAPFAAQDLVHALIARRVDFAVAPCPNSEFEDMTIFVGEEGVRALQGVGVQHGFHPRGWCN